MFAAGSKGKEKVPREAGEGDVHRHGDSAWLLLQLRGLLPHIRKPLCSASSVPASCQPSTVAPRPQEEPGPTPWDSHFTWIISIRPSLQLQSHSEVLGGSDFNTGILGDVTQPEMSCICPVPQCPQYKTCTITEPSSEDQSEDSASY